MPIKKAISLAILTAIYTAAVNAEEISTTIADQTGLNVTIYNSNIALIKDQRKIRLGQGMQTLAFKDVSAAIQPETAILKADKITLLEQNFEYDLLSPEALLNKYIGKTVTVAKTNTATGEVTKEQATVLANNNGVMLKIADKIRQLGDDMTIIYNNVPDNLRDKPTLTLTLDNQGVDEQTVELSYLSEQLNWQADYVANLVDEKTLNLKGWVTLTNNTGTTYNDATLQLVAGEVNRVQTQGANAMKKKSREMAAAAPMADMQEESLFEYHLYTLGFPTTIKNKQQKQVSLLESANIPYEKRLVVTAFDPYGWRAWSTSKNGASEYVKQTVNAKVIIANKKANHLGIPLPAGIIRTYQNDSKGNMQFIGEDHIMHTPENESVSLQLGESFDVTVKRKQTDFQQLGKNSFRAAYSIVFKNAKEHTVSVDYHDNFWNNWTIDKESIPSKKLNSTLNRWRVSVPAKGETTLTYTVTISYP